MINRDTKKIFAGYLCNFLLMSLFAIFIGNDAYAQSNPLGGFKHDATLPIEIAADSLEIKQDEEQAIFDGNVEAQQGVMTLTADRLIVEYTQGDSSAEETDNPAGAIKKVIARGNVFISSETESAQGEWADYDVVAGKILMGGGVFLTKDDNALEGEKMSINLNTGHAKLEKAAGGRVRGVFTPPKKKQN